MLASDVAVADWPPWVQVIVAVTKWSPDGPVGRTPHPASVEPQPLMTETGSPPSDQ